MSHCNARETVAENRVTDDLVLLTRGNTNSFSLAVWMIFLGPACPADRDAAALIDLDSVLLPSATVPVLSVPMKLPRNTICGS